MDVWETLDKACEDSSMTIRKVSHAIGKSRNYIHTMRFQKNIPSVDSYGMMLASCKYKLCAVKGKVPKNAIVIDSFTDGTAYEERLSELDSQESE